MISTTTGETLVLVENDSEWAKSFAGILSTLGEPRRLVIAGQDRFLQDYSASSDFDNVSVCLIDLELGVGISSERADKDGLDIVLPHVRALAPWVPTACVSRYISGSDEIIAELSCSDFDAFFPKAIVGSRERLHSEFNVKRWKSIIRDMYLRRIATQTGSTVLQLRKALDAKPQFQMDLKTRNSVASVGITEANLQEGLSLLGLGGTEYTLSALEPGFSGIQVSKVRVSGFDKDESVNSTWLLKWGHPVRKLAEEAYAHRLFMKRGMKRTLQVPQFHPHAIAWNGIGFLAYAFEADATNALVFLSAHGPLRLGDSLRALCSDLYRSCRPRAVNLAHSLNNWFPAKDEGTDSALLEEDRSVDITWALVHGDLHLRNIFIRSGEATLIDFARAAFAPVAIDAAKLLADCLAVGPAPVALSLGAASWRDIEQTEYKPLLDAFKPFLGAPDDWDVFDVMLRRYLIKYTEYEDIAEERRAAFRRLVRAELRM